MNFRLVGERCLSHSLRVLVIEVDVDAAAGQLHRQATALQASSEDGHAHAETPSKARGESGVLSNDSMAIGVPVKMNDLATGLIWESLNHRRAVPIIRLFCCD